MVIVKSVVHGAVSLVNAIATGSGAAVGIDTFVKTTLEVKEGTGIYITSDNKTISSRLINKVIQNSVPKKQLEKNKIRVRFSIKHSNWVWAQKFKCNFNCSVNGVFKSLSKKIYR